MNSSLSELSSAYQAQLELLRTDPDNLQLQEDLAKAKRAIEIAWMEVVCSTHPSASES